MRIYSKIIITRQLCVVWVEGLWTCVAVGTRWFDLKTSMEMLIRWDFHPHPAPGFIEALYSARYKNGSLNVDRLAKNRIRQEIHSGYLCLSGCCWCWSWNGFLWNIWYKFSIIKMSQSIPNCFLTNGNKSDIKAPPPRSLWHITTFLQLCDAVMSARTKILPLLFLSLSPGSYPFSKHHFHEKSVLNKCLLIYEHVCFIMLGASVFTCLITAD